ncbi:eukaryotic translation initiation factor 4 gamma [Periplaneta americana]|uniref:eukaryotic translation initiation factor 4 gamma n=1 Tax=Periplaneta americana TaxID=6978 RepID=UPI0037E7F061
MGTNTICILMSALLSLSVGLPVRYDQRQEGDLNVHAHLENFIIVLIPNSGGLGILDLLPLKKDVNRHVVKPSSSVEGDSDAGKYVPPSTAIKSSSPDFPAGKSPYKVDLVSGDSDPVGQEVVIAHSKTSTPSSESPTTTTTFSPNEKTSSKPPVEESSEKNEKNEASTTTEGKTDEPTTEKAGDSKKKEDEVPVVNFKPEKPVKSPKTIDFGIEVPLIDLRKVTEDDVPEIDFTQTLRSKAESDELISKRKFLSSGLQSASEQRQVSADEIANKLKSLRSGIQECGPDQRQDSLGNCVYFRARSLIAALQTGLSPADS